MDLVAVFAVFALFVFMLSLLCFCVLPFSSVNKDLYTIRSRVYWNHGPSGDVACSADWVPLTVDNRLTTIESSIFRT